MNESTPRPVTVAEILLAEKLYEIQALVPEGEGTKAHERAFRIAMELGNRLSLNNQPKIAAIRDGMLFLENIH